MPTAANATDRSLFVPRILTAEEVATYSRQGYLAAGRVLSDHGIEEIQRQTTEAWQRHKQGFSAEKSWLENTLLPNVHHLSAAVRDFYFDGPLVDIATQVVSPNIKGATSQLTFKMRGNTKPVQWHQDNGYGQLDPYNSISCLTALDDVDQANGCLWIIPGSHQRGQMSHHDGTRSSEFSNLKPEQVMEVDEAEAIPLTMKAGECLFFHGWTLHKSEGNFSDRDRRILFFRYADADAIERDKGGKPRLGRLLRGTTQFPEVRDFESNL